MDCLERIDEEYSGDVLNSKGPKDFLMILCSCGKIDHIVELPKQRNRYLQALSEVIRLLVPFRIQYQDYQLPEVSIECLLKRQLRAQLQHLSENIKNI